MLGVCGCVGHKIVAYPTPVIPGEVFGGKAWACGLGLTTIGEDALAVVMHKFSEDIPEEKAEQVIRKGKKVGRGATIVSFLRQLETYLPF